jgi:hypothetical protein
MSYAKIKNWRVKASVTGVSSYVVVEASHQLATEAPNLKKELIPDTRPSHSYDINYRGGAEKRRTMDYGEKRTAIAGENIYTRTLETHLKRGHGTRTMHCVSQKEYNYYETEHAKRDEKWNNNTEHREHRPVARGHGTR